MRNKVALIVSMLAFTLFSVWADHGAEFKQRHIVLPSTELGYSPDGSLVVFPRSTSELPAFSPDDDTDPRELWIARRDGSAARRLLKAKSSNDPERNLETFASPEFAVDGHHIYFLSRAWPTTWALHVYDLNDGTEHFVRSAASFQVITTGPYSGCLLITDHTYSKVLHSFYYPHSIVTPGGAEVVKIGDKGSDNDPKLLAWRQRFMPSSPSATASSIHSRPHNPRCK